MNITLPAYRGLEWCEMWSVDVEWPCKLSLTRLLHYLGRVFMIMIAQLHLARILTM